MSNKGPQGRVGGLISGLTRNPPQFALQKGTYIRLTTSQTGLIIPAGTWMVRGHACGGAGGGCTAMASTAHSAGGGAAGCPFEGTIVSDGYTPYTVVIPAVATGVSGATGNTGAIVELYGGMPQPWPTGGSLGAFIQQDNSVFLQAPGGGGGEGGTNGVNGLGALPGIYTPLYLTSAAPQAYFINGGGGGLGSVSAGIAASNIYTGAVGGGSGAPNASSEGGNGGGAGTWISGGAPGSGTTGTTTGGNGQTATNQGCGGGGGGASFTGGSDTTGGNGGPGLFEAWRIS